jgi:ABC-type Fe3+ transport system, periplasmic component
VKAFEDKTGITVNVRSDDEDALANQIATEGARSPADLFFTENTPPLELLQDKGLLSAVKPARSGWRPLSTARRRATGPGCRPGSA